MSSRQNLSGTDAQDKPQRAMQALKAAITPPRDNLQSHTAPTTPTRASMKQALTSSAAGLSVSMTSNKTLKIQQRANTDTNGMDLCPWQVPTDPDDMEEDDALSESPRESKSEIQRKSSVKSFSNLTTSMKKARMRRSQSAKKDFKDPTLSKSPKSIVQWPKKVVPEISKTEKNSARFKEKPRRSLPPVYNNAERNDSPRQKKKVMKTAVGDLEFDLEEKCATEGEEPENLFEEGGNDKELNLKELGPVRYSKMSEEDAEKVFELRKRELLAFLIKLGANPSLVKKKLASKNIGLPKQLDTSGHLAGLRGSAFDRDRVMRSLRGGFEDNVSPNRFIVYNTDNDPLWNNNQNRGRFATPKHKSRAASYKASGKTEPIFKRRNSAKILRDKEDLNIAKRDLTSSFNQAILDGNDVSDTKSPIKAKRKNPQLRNSHQIILDPHDVSDTKSPSKAKKSADATTTNKEADEKKEVIELTIDLVKLCSDEKKKKKKKKSKKTKKPKNEEKVFQSEQASDTNKAPSENVSVNTAWESHEESIAYQKLIETMRQKSKVALGEIDQIDMQIQRMKDDGKRGKSQKRNREENILGNRRNEKKQEIFFENLEEGYAQAAKMRNAKRSGSYSFTADQFEATPKYGGASKRFGNTRENETERLRTGQDTTRTQISRSNKIDMELENKAKKIDPQVRPQRREIEQRPKSTVGKNENRKRNEYEQIAKGPLNSEISVPKTPINRQNLSPNSRQQKIIPLETKPKTLSSEKSGTGIDRRPNPIQTQSLDSQAIDRNKLLNAFRSPAARETQKFVEQNPSKSAATPSNSQVQSTRGGISSRPNPSLAMNKKVISTPNSATPNPVPSTAATSNKSPILSRKPVKKGLTMNKSQQSIDKDASSEINETSDLFDRPNIIKSHKPTKSATKATFSEGVKKILREGSNEDNQHANPKPTKNLPRSPQFTPKMMESNRPKFEVPSVTDIRAKIYNGAISKVNGTQNGGNNFDLNKRDLKDIVLEDLRSPVTTKKANQPEIQSFQKNAGLPRKRSLSPPQDNNQDNAKYQINSMQDINDKKTKINSNDIEHAERLKLLGQSVKIKRETPTASRNQARPYKI